MAQVARELRAYLEPPIESNAEAGGVAPFERLAALVDLDEADAAKMAAAARADALGQIGLVVSSHFAEGALVIRERLPRAFAYYENEQGESISQVIKSFGTAPDFVFHRLGWCTSPARDPRAQVSYSVAALTTGLVGWARVGATLRVFEYLGALEYTGHEWEIVRTMALDVDKLQPDLDAFKARALGDSAVMLQEPTRIMARPPATPPPPFEPGGEAARN